MSVLEPSGKPERLHGPSRSVSSPEDLEELSSSLETGVVGDGLGSAPLSGLSTSSLWASLITPGLARAKSQSMPS